jgi:uncharacterized C2H2 Zn-finger protein
MTNSTASDERRRWVLAANELIRDPAARVRCPACDRAFLEAQKILSPDGAHYDLYLRCPSCHRTEVVTGQVSHVEESKDA